MQWPYPTETFLCNGLTPLDNINTSLLWDSEWRKKRMALDKRHYLNNQYQKQMIHGYYLCIQHNGSDETFPYRIHGLWPHKNATVYPRYCSGLAFNNDNFLPLLPKLHQCWHNFEGKDENFWKQEWRKHGTCTGLTEAMYFEKTIECFEKVRDKGKAWVHLQPSLRIPFGLDLEINTELFF